MVTIAMPVVNIMLRDEQPDAQSVAPIQCSRERRRSRRIEKSSNAREPMRPRKTKRLACSCIVSGLRSLGSSMAMLDLGVLDGIMVAIGLDADRWKVIAAFRTTYNGRPALRVDAMIDGDRVEMYADLARYRHVHESKGPK